MNNKEDMGVIAWVVIIAFIVAILGGMYWHSTRVDKLVETVGYCHDMNGEYYVCE